MIQLVIAVAMIVGIVWFFVRVYRGVRQADIEHAKSLYIRRHGSKQ